MTLTVGVYVMEACAAGALGWVSWYGRPPAQVVRHHGGFAVVMGLTSVPMLLNWPLTSEWLAGHRAMRIWLLSAGMTNYNESFIVFQNFMYMCGQDSLTPPWVFRQRCLALFAMVQNLIFMLPAALYILWNLTLPAFWNVSATLYGISSLGFVLLVLTQLAIQAPDSIKVWNKLMDSMKKHHQ